jgi:transaldolase
MNASPLKDLTAAGQAIWLDYLHQDLLRTGELQRLIADDGVTGLTSNPSIFEKAIGDGDAYDARIKTLLAASRDAQPLQLYEQIAVADIQAAADQFRPTYDRLGGRDGYVSLEVSPSLAHDTQGTVAEARRLWRAVDRPNLMIKAPGTKAGTAAIRELIGEGVNVNVTLLFGIDAYLAVADAHMAGLEARKASGGDISTVHGVASFFVSRIDTAIDKAIDEKLKSADGPTAARLTAVRGKVAIANAKIAYQHYLELVGSGRWRALASAGAAPQRLLWASTGTKDPAYSDVLYVEALIGPDTVNTMPPKTLAAFRDHGKVVPSLTQAAEEAARTLAEAEALGLDLGGVTNTLVDEGVDAFAKAFEDLLGAVGEKRARIAGDRQAAGPAHV